MRIALLLTSVLFFTLNSWAGDGKKPSGSTLEGKVVDAANHETLPGAEVSIEALGLKTYCDIDGRFSFEGLPQGEHVATVSYVSYEVAEFPLQVGEKGAMPVKLSIQSR